MSEAIYIQHDGNLTRMELEAYSREDDFQSLLADHPDLLAGDQIDSSQPRRWLLISREAAIPSREGGSDRWSLDLLLIDQDAIPTFVEVKRKSDTRLRREVVGQMMEYAANAVTYWNEKTLQDQFEQTAIERSSDPAVQLAAFLQNEADETYDDEGFWAEAYKNLRDGKVRLIFVADRIPRELQRIVEFMNERMSPTEVLALELRRYSGGAFSTHIPRVLGQTSAAQIAKQAKSSAKRQSWTKETFLENVEGRLDDWQVEHLRKVLEFCQTSAFSKIEFGTGKAPYCLPKCSAISTRAPIGLRANGELDIRLSWLTDTEMAIAFRDRFQEKLQRAGLPHDCPPNEIIQVPMAEWSEWSDQLLEAMQAAAEETLTPSENNQELAPAHSMIS